MNDRCASGTGRFFDVLARALEVDVSEVGPLAMSGADGLEVSSMCATFAETRSSRCWLKVRRKRTSLHPYTKLSPHERSALRHPVELLAEPQIAVAYGAGLLAHDEYLGSIGRTETLDSAAKEQLTERAAGRVPVCAGCDGNLDHPHTHEAIPLTLRSSR